MISLKIVFSSILMLTALFVITILDPLPFVNAISENSLDSIAYFPSPLKQISQGVEPSHVTCTEGKAIVLKQSNGLSACVNPSSVEKLILRGWAIHILPDYSNENNNSKIFNLGEFIIESETVAYFGDTMGYLAKPAIDGNFPGIVMIHEWWGLNDNIMEMADKLASLAMLF